LLTLTVNEAAFADCRPMARAPGVHGLRTPGIERLVEIAGRRDMVDAFEPAEDQTQVAIERWQLRW